MYYFVWYNGAFIAQYKSVRACLNFINRKRLQNDYKNCLDIVDQNGDLYNLITSNKIN